MCLILFGLGLGIPLFPVTYNLYCILWVFMYGMYLVYDTQLISGNGRYGLTLDDYIVGALILYIDVIGLFMELLKLLARN
jgi:FtsH-binding integral membrane protein